MMIEQNIKVQIKGKKYDELPNVAQLPIEVNNLLIKPKKNKLTLNGIRFILLLAANLKDRQIAKSKIEQLLLFDEEMFNFDNETNYTTALSFHYSDFLPKGNKNYSQVKKGIEELRNLRYQEKIPIFDKKSGKHREAKVNSSLILSYIEEERRGFKIIIDLYWYRLFINMTNGFNPFIKTIAFNIKSLNTIQFYFYLKKLPQILPKEEKFFNSLKDELKNFKVLNKGTKTYLNNLSSTLKIPYKYESEIIRDYLDPIRSELNKFGDISFNYKIENKFIIILVYDVPKVLIGAGIVKSETIKIKKAINYKIKLYDIQNQHSLLLIEIYLKYSYDLVLKVTNKNKNLRGLKGENYYSVFLLLLEKYCREQNIQLDKIGYSQDDKNKIRKELMKNTFTFI